MTFGKNARRLAAMGSCLLLGGVLVGCRTGAPARSESGPVPIARAAATATPPPGPAKTRTTPRAIACGAKSCDLASEVCCADAQGNGLRCAPRPKDDSVLPCAENELTKLCDENADCAAGSLCCMSWPCTGGCPPRYECEATRCSAEVGEMCLRGGSCSAGFECRSEPEREQGSCFQRDPGSDCGGKRCSGSTPVCRWVESARAGTCVASDESASTPEPEAGVTWLRCSSAADCSGYTCGKLADMPFLSFHCAGPSLAGDRFWPILCADKRDCPPHWGKTATDCAAPSVGESPAFTRVCVYPE